MRFRISWHSRMVDGTLQTVGALAVGPRKLVYVGSPDRESDEDVFNRSLLHALTEFEQGVVFGYHIESGNGVTMDWSEPEDRAAESVDALKAELRRELAGA